MIIDVHAHLGWDCVFDEDFTEQEQLEKHRRYGISKTILQPGTCHDLETVMEQHDAIASMIKRFEGQFCGMSNPNPHLKDSLYEGEVRRCIEDMGFVGIKLHPFAHAVNPCSKDGRKVFMLADKLCVPVMVHTGPGIPFANPSNLIPLAEEYGNVKIIMAHCGLGISSGEVTIVMKRCSNVFADISWTAGFQIRHWVSEFGAHRFMFGSDHADNAGTELEKIRTCGLTKEEQEWILFRSSKIFGDSPR